MGVRKIEEIKSKIGIILLILKRKIKIYYNISHFKKYAINFIGN